MSQRHLAAIATTFVLAVALNGCGGHEVPPELSVIDHTGSSSAGSTKLCADHLVAYARARYVDVDSNRGELRSDVFDAATAPEPTFPVRVDFEVPARAQSSPNKTIDALEEVLKSLKRQLGNLSASAGPSQGPTDVVTMLTSVGEAARAIGARRIWVCSDMVDNRLRRPITTTRVDTVLADLKRTGSLPNLKGINVIVDTTSVRGRIGFNPAEISALRDFTTRLISMSQGTLIAYGPGAGSTKLLASSNTGN